MILVDTSVWIDHFRKNEPDLAKLLVSGQVMVHPFVIGELACGNLKNRNEILSALMNLPSSPTTTDSETLFFIEQRQLMGLGIGYIDAHLLASTALMGNGYLWSRDKRLAAAAVTLHLGFLDSKFE